MPRRRFSPVSRLALIERLRELGYDVAQTQDALTALGGTVVSLAEENDAQQATINRLSEQGYANEQAIADLKQRLAIQEAKQPTSFS